ncbi:21901_t:CDS:2, partial [Rhizophagus irregularis]
ANHLMLKYEQFAKCKQLAKMGKAFNAISANSLPKGKAFNVKVRTVC